MASFTERTATALEAKIATLCTEEDEAKAEIVTLQARLLEIQRVRQGLELAIAHIRPADEYGRVNIGSGLDSRS
jgi:hypothetical protein